MESAYIEHVEGMMSRVGAGVSKQGWMSVVEFVNNFQQGLQGPKFHATPAG
jgi:hypothetical protein